MITGEEDSDEFPDLKQLMNPAEDNGGEDTAA
jgi:hypothetical protein